MTRLITIGAGVGITASSYMTEAGSAASGLTQHLLNTGSTDTRFAIRDDSGSSDLASLAILGQRQSNDKFFFTLGGTGYVRNFLHVGATGTDPLRLVGVQTSTDTDVLTLDSTGLVTKRDANSLFGVNLQQTLFVDPNGNNATAEVGNIRKPYLTIGGALNKIITDNLNGYTVHVFKGNYTETTGYTFGNNEGFNMWFEDGVTLTFNAASTYFITCNSTSRIEISIAGTDRPLDAAMSSASCKIQIRGNSGLLRNTGNLVFSLNGMGVNNGVNSGSFDMLNCTAGADSYYFINDSHLNFSPSISGTASVIQVNSGSYVERFTINNSVLKNHGTSNSYATILFVSEKVDLRIYNSYIISKAGGGIRVAEPQVLEMSNVILYNISNPTTAYTIYDTAATGTTEIDIGARCISNMLLPDSAGSTLLNRAGGDLDCSLNFAEPFVDLP